MSFKNLKTLFTVKSYRKKWIWTIVAVVALVIYLLSALFALSVAGSFSLNPFTIVKRFAETHTTPPIGLILFICLILALLLTAKMARNIGELRSRGVDWSDNNTYGSAQEATAEDIKDIALVHSLKDCEGPILGRMTPDSTDKTIEFRVDENIINANALVIGPAGSGKSFCYVLNMVYQALHRGCSLIVADTKGAIYNATVELARKMGYIVRCFNTKDHAYSNGWNCFRELYDADGNISSERVTTFATTVVKNISSAKTEPIYINGPIALLKSALFFVASNDAYGDGPRQRPRTFESAYRFLLENSESALDILFDPDTRACSQEAIDAYRAYKDSSQNVRGNLKTNLATGLNSLSDKLIAKMTGTDEIDLSLPAKQRCVYYLTVPDNNRSYDFYSALFVEFLFKDMTDFADSLPSQKCLVPVYCVLDEFANLGYLPNFDEKPTTTRSRDIAISIIVQSLGQLRDHYESGWEIIIGNCGTWVGLGFNDLFTMEYFSKMCGQATIATTSEQRPAHMPIVNFGLPHSVGEGKRAVFNPDELRRLGFQEEILLFQGRNVVRCWKFPHVLHPYSKECQKTQIKYMPKITDAEGRQYWLAMEKERVVQQTIWNASDKTGTKPEFISLKDLARGNHTLTEYKNSFYSRYLSTDDTVMWERLGESNEVEFLGRLAESEKPAMADHADEAHSDYADQDVSGDGDGYSQAQDSIAEILGTSHRSGRPSDLADIFDATPVVSPALEEAFGAKRKSNRRLPGQTSLIGHDMGDSATEKNQ